uniref:Uncharacterized protein n=1 Tax=Kalanchoe fedtschenkoi TaxID=63787 RepID=A0A7N0UT47_KALFE
MATGGVKKGPWSEQEDEQLLSYISKYGHGHWEAMARKAGLNRTGKSCRLRWLNHLRPGVRRGNITLQEQLIILQLHSRWGNRWAKIAECLPGRSDNEIKNYWRTRVQKQAKQLRCDVNSHQFIEIVQHVWMPQLAERVQTQCKSSPTITQELECCETSSISCGKLSNDSSNTHSDAAPLSIPCQLSDPSSSHAYNNDSNRHVSDAADSDPAWRLGAGLEADTYQMNVEKETISCEDYCPWSEQGLEVDKSQELLETAAWYDHDYCYSLENLLNDDDMMILCQQFLFDDHRA